MPRIVRPISQGHKKTGWDKIAAKERIGNLTQERLSAWVAGSLWGLSSIPRHGRSGAGIGGTGEENRLDLEGG
jgi:hypothetical protein